MYRNETRNETSPAAPSITQRRAACVSWRRRGRQAAAPLLAAGLLAAGAAHAPAAPASDSMAERTRACTACHGKEGRATREGFFPRIAGKPAGYLYNQLVNFRDGRRQNPAMVYLVQHLSDGYLQEIAQYYGALDLPYPPLPAGTPPAAELARGEALVTRGDPGRKIPSCAECHGQALTGVLPAIPGVLGLPRNYLVGEFGAWRNGQRRAADPDCMAEITKRMSAEDVAAVASWLASRPMPADTKPAAAVKLPLPIECGSGLQGPKP
jgi:cytochrome c553